MMNIYAIAHELNELTERDSLFRKIAEGELGYEDGLVIGDPGDVDNFLYLLIDITHNTAEELDNWIDKKSLAPEVAESLAQVLEDYEYNNTDVKVTDENLKHEIDNLISLVNNAKSFIEANSDYPGAVSCDFYVYVHENLRNGEVFYVGKGEGKRAWSKHRESYWVKYVESIEGKYSVKIVAKGLSESEALRQEEDMLIKYAKTAINRDEPVGVSFDLSGSGVDDA